MSISFGGKVVLITGGASGIGAATSEAFAQYGATVMVADINQETGQALAEKLRIFGVQAQFCCADATKEEDVERLVRTTVETFGALHIAANIVGLSHGSSLGSEFHTQSASGWDVTIAGCLRSTLLCCKHEIIHMLKHGGGCITNVSSTAGMRYVPLAGASYSAAKAAVIHFTKFAAVTYADRSIRVNCIAPGTTLTPAFAPAAVAAYPELSPEAALEKFIDVSVANHAIKRATEPSDQANAIVWLSSDAASMVTGQIVGIDGGWNAR